MAEPAARVLSLKRAGDFFQLLVLAPEVAEAARPGQFVMLGVGGETSAAHFPRPFWVARARPTGVYGGTVEVVFAVRGAGTRWLSRLREGDRLPVNGPLGRPFALPDEPSACVVVGYDAGTAAVLALSERLRERGCRVHAVVAGSRERSLYGVLEVRRAASSVDVLVAAGPAGLRDVTAAVGGAVRGEGARLVYAAAPVPLLAAVARVARDAGASSQVALEVPMPCGVGICTGCVVPVATPDGGTEPVRCCAEGAVLDGAAVDWSMLVAPPDGEQAS